MPCGCTSGSNGSERGLAHSYCARQSPRRLGRFPSTPALRPAEKAHICHALPADEPMALSPAMKQGRAWLAAVALSLTAGCVSLPPLEGRTESTALVNTDETRLGRAIAARAAAHPGKTGIHALSAGTDAFAAR